MAFELAWKLMKDYLEEQGLVASSPKETIKEAFKAGIIEDGHVWIDALGDRNLTVHTYDQETAKGIEKRIRENYFSAFKALYQFFKNQSYLA